MSRNTKPFVNSAIAAVIFIVVNIIFNRIFGSETNHTFVQVVVSGLLYFFIMWGFFAWNQKRSH